MNRTEREAVRKGRKEKKEIKGKEKKRKKTEEETREGIITEEKRGSKIK